MTTYEEMIQFVRARLDEEATLADKASEGPWTVGEDNGGFPILGQPTETCRFDHALDRHVAVPVAAAVIAGPGYEGGGFTKRADADHTVRHDPLKAKTRVDGLQLVLDECVYWHERVQLEATAAKAQVVPWPGLPDRFEVAMAMLRGLTQIWRWHPHWQIAWVA